LDQDQVAERKQREELGAVARDLVDFPVATMKQRM